MFILGLRADQPSGIGRIEFWMMGSFPCRQTSATRVQLPAFTDTPDSQKKAHFPGTASFHTHWNPRLPCLNRAFLKETISSARFSAEEAPVGSRAVLGWFLCAPLSIELVHRGVRVWVMAPHIRGGRSSFAISQVKSSAAELVTLMVLYSDILISFKILFKLYF